MQFRGKFQTEETQMSLYENSIRIKGFLGKDAVTKSITNGAIFVAFSVATKSSHKDKQSGEWVSQTFWHRITAFGKPALDANNLGLKKGDYVEISGELRSSEYTAKSGEAKTQRRSWEVRANSIAKLPAPARHVQEVAEAEPVEDPDEVPV
jgi:single-strand DNA-binding protein